MKDLNSNLLRYNQRELLKRDMESYDVSLTEAKGKDKALLLHRKAKAQRMLDTQSPEKLSVKEQDKLNVLEKKLRSRITENMPTEEVMRKNPPGAIDWNTRWLAANKKAINIWKNVRLQLNPESEDRDLANIERYRPSGQMDHIRTDAQIQGHMAFAGLTDEEWPFEPPQNTALAQAQRVYDSEQAEKDVEAELERSAKDDSEARGAGYGPSGNLTLVEYEELKARLAKGREALAAKRAAEKLAVSNSDVVVPDNLTSNIPVSA